MIKSGFDFFFVMMLCVFNDVYMCFIRFLVYSSLIIFRYVIYIICLCNYELFYI